MISIIIIIYVSRSLQLNIISVSADSCHEISSPNMALTGGIDQIVPQGSENLSTLAAYEIFSMNQRFVHVYRCIRGQLGNIIDLMHKDVTRFCVTTRIPCTNYH